VRACPRAKVANRNYGLFQGTQSPLILLANSNGAQQRGIRQQDQVCAPSIESPCAYNEDSDPSDRKGVKDKEKIL
jgi:hypothetical protein